MDWLWIVIAVVVIVALAVPLLRRRRKTKDLQEGFGPEYERTLEERGGSRSDAEEELSGRRERRDKLDIKPLETHVREHYVEAWERVQRTFVDTPGEALHDSHTLVLEVMERRGYPTDDFDQRAADISVDHPEVVQNYRAAHAVSQASERDRVSTEEQRKALVHYRALFDELLAVEPAAERQEVSR